jgi:hypothetical protein
LDLLFHSGKASRRELIDLLQLQFLKKLRTDMRMQERAQTPTGKGLGLDSSLVAGAPLRQRSKRPCSRLIKPVYQ